MMVKTRRAMYDYSATLAATHLTNNAFNKHLSDALNKLITMCWWFTKITVIVGKIQIAERNCFRIILLIARRLRLASIPISFQQHTNHQTNSTGKTSVLFMMLTSTEIFFLHLWHNKHLR
ncbi:hypothetical protein E8R43_07000 [Escherichia coli]|nr:hypothetical protein E8R43_07000 [Escherichia coli]